MNKLLKSIVAATVGIAMAIGAGVGLGREAKAVYAASVSNLEFTAACGGTGTADNDVIWTVTSDAAESAFDNTKGIHYGTGKAAVSYLNLSTSGITDTITNIVVNASGASKTSAKLNVTVGDAAFGSEQSLTSSAANYTFTGSATGEIVVSLTQDSATKALYCKSISVTYGSGSAPVQTYTVTYDANGGTGTISDDNSPYNAGSTVTVLDNEFSKEGYEFVNWNTAANGSGDTYDENNNTFVINENTTLYAQWNEVLPANTVKISYSGSTGNMTGNNDAQLLGVSENDWSVVGYKNKASNFPGLNQSGQIRLYGNSAGGNYISVKALSNLRFITSIDLNTDHSTNFAVYSGDATTSGTPIIGSEGTYSFGNGIKAFTIINTNSDTTQVYILSIYVHYSDNQSEVHATSVAISTHLNELVVGKTDSLSATISPTNSTDEPVWTSSVPTVATVNNGLVTAVSAGDTVISVSAGPNAHDEYNLHVVAVNAANLYSGATIDVVAEVIAVNTGTHKEAFLDDGTSGLLAYNSDASLTAEVGSVVRVTGTGKVFNGSIEVDNASFGSGSGTINKISATPLSTNQVDEYFQKYNGQSSDLLPHNKVSLTTGIIGGSNYYLTWEFGSHMMETHLSTGNMEVGYQYNIEGYLSKFATNNNVTYLCIVVTSAVKIEPTVDDPSEYLEGASSFANIYGKESSTTSVNFDFTSQGYENAESITNVSFDSNINLVCDEGSNSQYVPGYYTNGSTLHVYSGNTMTFSSGNSGAKIIKIEFTLPDSSHSTGLATETGTIKNGVWNGDASSIEFSLNSQVRISAIKVTYYQGSFSVESVGMRFGVSIAKSKWDVINNDSRWQIVDYGVMMVKKATLQNTYAKTSVEAAYRAGLRLSVSNKLKDGAYADPYLTGNVYSFTARLSSIPSTDYNTVVCAAPFIVVEDENNNQEYYFFTEIEKSVKELAGYYLTNGGSSLSDKALTILAA